MANELKTSKLVLIGGEPLRLPIRAADPVSGMVEGDLYYNSTSDQVRVFDGTVWAAVAGVSAAADVSFDNVASGLTATNVQDAIDETVVIAEAAQADATQALADAGAAQADATQALADAAAAQGDATAALQDAADLATLSGVAANSTNLGTFTGTTIPDSSTIKSALQSLETAVESVPSSGTVDDLVTLSGVAANSTDLGTFTGALIPDASTIKGALQAVETGAEDAQADATQALSDAADAQSAAADAQIDVDDLVTLSGVAVNSVDLGTFTGNVIPATSTIKQALQYLGDGLENLPDPIVYLGTWSAATNTPTLANGSGISGSLYQVNAAGTVNFGAGAISFEIGDKVVYNGTIWEKWDMTDAVTSVNGQAGVVVLDSDDIDEGVTNLYYTDARAKAAAVDNAIVDGVTDVAPSQEAVFEALALKADASAIADVVDGPASAVDNRIARFDGTSGKLIQNSAITVSDTGDLTDVATAVIGDISIGVASATSITSTSLTLESDTGSIQIISETDVILDSSVSGSVVVGADVPFKRGGVTDAVEERYYHALSLAANTVAFTTVSGLSFDNATYDGLSLEFRIKEATTGLVRIGKMYVAADGTDVSYSPQYTETGIVGAIADGEGLKLRAVLSGGDILIQFNDTKASNACSMNVDVKLFKA